MSGTQSGSDLGSSGVSDSVTHRCRLHMYILVPIHNINIISLAVVSEYIFVASVSPRLTVSVVFMAMESWHVKLWQILHAYS